MKPTSNETFQKEWRFAAALFSLVVLLSFSITPTLAQLKKAKRITAVRLGTATEGSRVSIHSDSGLNDYEAFRRGDRFFVKIPSASFLSSQPLFRGAGFQEILVQEIGDTVVISFWLQPGASANVEQRGTKLDVVFSVFAGVATRNATAPTSGEERQRWIGPVGGQTAEVSRQGLVSAIEPAVNDVRPRLDRAGAAAEVTTPTAKSTDTEVRSTEHVSTRTEQSPAIDSQEIAGQVGVPTAQSPTGARSTSPAQDSNSSSDNRSNWERRRDVTIQWVKNNWVISGSISFLLMTFAVWLAAHRRSPADRLKTAKASNEPLQPIDGTTSDRYAESVSLFNEDMPTDAPVSMQDITDESITEIPSSASPDITQNTLPTAPTVESVSFFSEATALNSEQLFTNVSKNDQLDAELQRLFAGEDYDSTLIGTRDLVLRKEVVAALLAAIASHDVRQHQPARQAFIDHGYLDEVTAELRTAESAADRAAAARKLGVIGSLQANQSLLAGLSDSAPEVRLASVEALGKVGDRSALPALNDLLVLETSELVPEHVIRQAINSITLNETRSSVPERPTLRVVENPKLSAQEEAEGEFIEFVDQFELTETVTEVESVSSSDYRLETIDTEFAAEEERLLQEEEGLRRAAEELEQRRLEAEAARKKAEEEARLKAESEAQLRAEVEARIRAEEEARRRAMEEAARRQAEEEARILAEQAERNRAEEEARLRAEEEARFQMEAQTLRRAAEELARKRAEAEAARKLAEEEARRRQEEEARRKLEEERRLRAVEEARLQAEAEARRKQEEEERARAEAEALRLAEEARRQAEAEALQQAIAEARRIAEEERRRKAEEEARLQAEEQKRLEEERAAQEAYELRVAEEQRLREEQEALAIAAAELARRRAEIEETRRKAEEEARQLAETRERMRAEEEATRRRLAEERERIEAETQLRIAEELKRLEEARRLAEEQQRNLEEEARRQEQEEQERLSALEALRAKAEQEARRRAEQEQRIRAEIEALRRAEEEQRQRIEVETQRRAEAEARSRVEEEKRRLEAEARLQAEEEAQRLAAEARLRVEEESLRRAEAEAQEARLRAEEAARLLTEAGAQRVAETQAGGEESDIAQVSDQTSWIDAAVDNLQAPAVAEAENMAEQSFNQIEISGSSQATSEVVEQKTVPVELLSKLESQQPSERAAALMDLARIGGDENFEHITKAFDDSSDDVRDAAVRALYALHSDRAASFTRALREGSPERRRRIGTALATSGLAADAISNLTGESREKTYDAFSLLFLMAKAGEVQPLMKAIEDYPNIEVRLAVVKLLALSGQPEIVPAFRRLAVRGSLPSEVRSAVMEAIYQISSQTRETTPSAA